MGSLLSLEECSSIATLRLWGWLLDVIATQTRKRHSRCTGPLPPVKCKVSDSLDFPTVKKCSLKKKWRFLSGVFSKLLIQGGRPLQAHHRPWYGQTHGRWKGKHWRICNSSKISYPLRPSMWNTIPFAITATQKVKAGKVVVEVGGLAEWAEVLNLTSSAISSVNHWN